MAWTTDTVEKKVFEIVARKLNIEESKIKKESSFVSDLRADSLDTMELIMEIEDTFNIDVPDEDAQKMQTVGDSVNYIGQKLREKGEL